MAAEKKTRTRMSPEARRHLILDQAEIIVTSDGIDALSIEGVATAASVSKSLVYSYFLSVTELLRALLEREHKHLRVRQAKAAKEAKTIQQLVRGVTHAYLSYIEERGGLIYLMESEPSVALGGPTRFSRDSSIAFLSKIMMKQFDIPEEVIVPAMDISFGLPDAAGRYLAEKKADRQTIEDITVAMILGCIGAIKDGYAVNLRPFSLDQLEG